MQSLYTRSFESVEVELLHLQSSLEDIFTEIQEETQQFDAMYPQQQVEEIEHDLGFEALRAISSIPDVSMEGVLDKLKAFFSFIQGTINRVTRAMHNFLGTGYPLMVGIEKKARELLSTRFTSREDGKFLDDAAVNALSINGHCNREQTLQVLDFLKETTLVLEPSRLNDFKNISSELLEPFRGAAKPSKGDGVILTLAILAALTNPAVVGNEILKKLFATALPDKVGYLDIASQGASLLNVAAGFSAIVSVIPTLGSNIASISRNASIGKLDTTVLPKYRPLYPFCTQEVPSKQPTIIDTFASKPLFGNRRWLCNDYADTVGGKMRGDSKSVGGKFIKDKELQKPNESNLEYLSAEEVKDICKSVIEIMTVCKGYAKNFNAQAKNYEQLYRQINDIVMGDMSEGGVRATYVRQAYRGAMNQVMGAVWQNCFGSNIEFIRYLTSTCKYLLRYCEASMVKAVPAP